jgi:TonB family protein
MSCNEVASVLDNHRIALLKPSERAAIDAHLASCEDCSAAWRATAELSALRVPAMPATLLERALLASRLPQSAPARRARSAVVAGAVLLAGAAAAAVAVVSMTREESSPATSSAPVEQSDTPATPAAVDERVVEAEVAPAAPQGDGVTSVELVETALSIAPIVRRPPDYPLEALKQRLAGHVQLKFDVTAAGTVENVSVVESSDAMFEEPAVRALSEWRYLPRIAAGKRAASTGIHTILRFEPGSDKQPPPDEPQIAAKREAAMREYTAFSDDLVIALDRLAADDLRGSELQLDQMQAIYGAGFPDLWGFYGYLFTVQGNYDRAIDAYERALSGFVARGQPRSGPWAPLATLYFARHQYDLALNTLVRQRAEANSALINNEGEVKALIARLRALGLTHESLEAP